MTKNLAGTCKEFLGSIPALQKGNEKKISLQTDFLGVWVGPLAHNLGTQSVIPGSVFPIQAPIC